MPLYEYQCRKCQHRFERIQKFSDPPLKDCPQCKGRVHRVLSSPAVHFKGSGWYATDYATKSKSTDSADSTDKKLATKEEKKAGETPAVPGPKSAD